MSYIRAKKVDLEEGEVSRDGAVHLELPDHGDAGEEMEIDNNLDDELLPAVLEVMNQIADLSEGEALVIWKVIF